MLLPRWYNGVASISATTRFASRRAAHSTLALKGVEGGAAAGGRRGGWGPAMMSASTSATATADAAVFDTTGKYLRCLEGIAAPVGVVVVERGEAGSCRGGGRE